jgi:hypothetical protein
MSTPSAKVRLAVTVFLAVILLVGAGAAVTRWALLPWALGAALKAGGATDVKFAVERASPWRLQLSDIGFNFEAVKIAAASASLERRHWWTPSLGRLSVQQARVDVDLDRVGASASGGGASPAPAEGGGRIPLEEISIDGQVVVHTGNEPEQALAVNFAARPVEEGTWQAEAKITAPGLEVGVEGSYRLTAGEGEFRSTALRLDLQAWQKWLEHWAPLPGGPWELAGTLTGEAGGEYLGGRLAARGEFHLRGARAASTVSKVTAEGVEADIDVADLTQLLARKATLRAKTVTSGAIVLSDLAAEFSRTESGRFDVAALSARALGGTLSVEPFVYRLGQSEVDAVILADGIRAEEVMALTEDLPARASGPLSGRLPVHYDGSGVRFGTGWLGLKEGASVEIQFHAAGLLTAGTSPKSPQYAVLKKVEDGILKLKVTELRLDIRPPNAPGTRTAQLHVVGAPVDPEVKAPVTLDLNVNGPIESLINLGMKSGASFGTKP